MQAKRSGDVSRETCFEMIWVKSVSRETHYSVKHLTYLWDIFLIECFT